MFLYTPPPLYIGGAGQGPVAVGTVHHEGQKYLRVLPPATDVHSRPPVTATSINHQQCPHMVAWTCFCHDLQRPDVLHPQAHGSRVHLLHHTPPVCSNSHRPHMVMRSPRHLSVGPHHHLPNAGKWGCGSRLCMDCPKCCEKKPSLKPPRAVCSPRGDLHVTQSS